MSQRKARGMGEAEKCLREFREKVLLSVSGLVERHLLAGHRIELFGDPSGAVVIYRCEDCARVLMGEEFKELEAEADGTTAWQ
jgi:hypothetical protein